MAHDLTFLCVFVEGHVGFTVEYVQRLLMMLKRRVRFPFQLVCLTDRPDVMPEGVDSVFIPTPRDYYAWWAKVELFNWGHEIAGDRFVYLDLDTLLVSPINQIINFPAPFALIPHDGDFEGRGQQRVVKRYNSSVMVWDRNYRVLENIWIEFNPLSTPKELWGDQDLIGELLPIEQTMPLKWFPRISQLDCNKFDPVPVDAKVVLCKKPKNAQARARYPWVGEYWQ